MDGVGEESLRGEARPLTRPPEVFRKEALDPATPVPTQGNWVIEFFQGAPYRGGNGGRPFKGSGSAWKIQAPPFWRASPSNGN
jgi:hypothetical protein